MFRFLVLCILIILFGVPMQLVESLSSDDDAKSPSPVGGNPGKEQSFDSSKRPRQSFDIKVCNEGLLYLELQNQINHATVQMIFYN